MNTLPFDVVAAKLVPMLDYADADALHVVSKSMHASAKRGVVGWAKSRTGCTMQARTAFLLLSFADKEARKGDIDKRFGYPKALIESVPFRLQRAGIIKTKMFALQALY